MRRCIFCEKFEPSRKREKPRKTALKSTSAGALEDRPGGGFNRFDQLARSQRDGMAAPAQNPPLNFHQARKLQSQLHAAVLRLRQLLRRVPALLPDVIGYQV